MRTHPRRGLVATLGAVILVVAVLQTGFIPIVGAIAAQLRVSPTAASWAMTANLITAAAATPLIGRLADRFNTKSVLLAVLAVVLAGSVLGAVASSLPLVVLARALQGPSFALYPIAVSILRYEVPAERLIRAIAALSMTLGFGGAVGLFFTGFLMPSGADFHRVFWLLAVMTIAVITPVVVIVPNHVADVEGPVDWLGGAALAVGLSLLMLAITQSSSWGISATVLTLSAGMAVLGAWRSRNRSHSHPLVAPAMLSRRPVMLANSAGFLVGMGSYFSLLGLSTFAAYRFGTSVQLISLQFMLPGAIAGTLTAVVAGRLIERFGGLAVLAGGGAFGLLGFGMLVGWHGRPWQVIVAGLLTSIYISLAYGALPAVIVGDVHANETAVANSINGIFRKIGGAAAAALVGARLTPVVGGAPSETGFLILFVAGALTAGAAVLLVWLGGRVRAGRPVIRLPGVPAAGAIPLAGLQRA